MLFRVGLHVTKVIMFCLRLVHTIAFSPSAVKRLKCCHIQRVSITLSKVESENGDFENAETILYRFVVDGMRKRTRFGVEDRRTRFKLESTVR